ncbi:hypothetical protein ACJRO7_006499 [Eucalyptus globulus]|uniref:Leucine-rich repeat-containing N-terminal plant-type domain-containing protein n=1 Tax=Eucalyptus globulus TaxID=34317 RepID=A0ABD3ILX9_EUCGL
MAHLLCFYMSIHLLLLYLSSQLIGAHNFSHFVKPLCLKNEMSALLQFKERYKIANVLVDPLVHPKILSWKNSHDCCSWNGIKCDENTGHVTVLDLGSSFLYGSIDNNSTLFQLARLEKPNLSNNHFKHSQIPSRIGDLSRLTHLDVSFSVFFQRLVHLGLCCNLDPYNSTSLLEMKTPGLRSLAQNLTNLEVLLLGAVNMSSGVPNTLANLSSLGWLNMDVCDLHGLFPSAVFHLPKLRFLGVGYNEVLTGQMPDFNSSGPLEELRLPAKNFSGEIPASIGNLRSLQKLTLMSYTCNLIGSLPASIGNLPSLSYLDIHGCKFSGSIPALFANISNLEHLDVSMNPFTVQPISYLSWLVQLDFLGNQLNGTIPSQLTNLIQLTKLCIQSNQLSGSISPWLTSMTQLVVLDLVVNNFHGEIPSSISQLQNLRVLVLAKNNFSCTIELDNFLKLKQLIVLQLSSNRLSCRTSSTNITLPQLQALGLASCNLSEFPTFLENQESMNWLDMSDNNIRGEVPFWDHPPKAPPSIMSYIVLKNRLTGALPPWIYNLSSAITLDLSSNNLTGGNNFQGSISELLVKGMQLTMLDLSDNQLQGKLPRSLANCKMLEFINFGSNLIADTIPSWLGSLSKLNVLILRSNKFHGVIKRSKSSSTFLKLWILDLSNNAFFGKLPREFFRSWNAMKSAIGSFTHAQRTIDDNNFYQRTTDDYNYFSLSYMGRNLQPKWYHSSFVGGYDYPMRMTLTYKGLKMYHQKISYVFTDVDLSSNFSEGEIPGVIGELKGLEGLNLSNNVLTGHIPSSLRNLTALESLDLSLNKLFGQIPQELTELGFLSFLNVSFNNLTGLVPRGKQLNTFSFNSFEGNSGLCGEFIFRKCQDSRDASRQPSIHQQEDFGSPIELDWKIVMLWYGSGLVIGVVIIGNAIFSWKHFWFEKSAKRRRQRPSRMQPKRLRNSWSGNFFLSRR